MTRWACWTSVIGVVGRGGGAWCRTGCGDGTSARAELDTAQATLDALLPAAE